MLYDTKLAKLQTDFTTNQWDFPDTSLLKTMGSLLNKL
jgi:hypothetical protein